MHRVQHRKSIANQEFVSHLKFQDLEWTTKILDSKSLRELEEIVEEGITGQILDLKYSIADSYATKSVVNVVDGESMDESRHVFWHPFALFIYSLKQYPMKKKHKKSISEPMPRFDNNTFSEYNGKVQRATWISVQKPISRFANNLAIFGNNLIGPLNINVGPSLPFHSLHFFFSHSSQVVRKM
jgi:N12 class adenine-specific DNA methylase